MPITQEQIKIPEYVKIPDRRSIMEKIFSKYLYTKNEYKMNIALSLLLGLIIIIIIIILIKSKFKLK